jgi:hypothetical protein
MSRLLPLLSAIVLVVLSGLVHARWSDRSSDTRELHAASARLGQLPWKIGDWTGDPVDFDGRGLDRSGISGLVTRRYENRRTGATVTIL